MGNAKSRHQLKRSRSWRESRDSGLGSIRASQPQPEFMSHCDDEQFKERLRSRRSGNMNSRSVSLDTGANSPPIHQMAGLETRIASVAARTTSKLRKLSSRSTRTSMSSSSGTSSTTSSFDAGHPKQGGQNLMASLAEAASRAIPEESTNMTRRQLELVQWTWHAVISDSANLCLNFFMDIHRMFPKRKNSSNSPGSSHQVSPGKRFLDRLMSSGSSGRSDSKSSSELSYNALKFTCAVDAAVRSMTENNFRGKVNGRTQEQLQEIGEELYAFFGVDELTPEQRCRMTSSFIEFLRLAVLHSADRARPTDLDFPEWSEEATEAWRAFFYKLLYHLENDDDTID